MFACRRRNRVIWIGCSQPKRLHWGSHGPGPQLLDCEPDSGGENRGHLRQSPLVWGSSSGLRKRHRLERRLATADGRPPWTPAAGLSYGELQRRCHVWRSVRHRLLRFVQLKGYSKRRGAGMVSSAAGASGAGGCLDPQDVADAFVAIAAVFAGRNRKSESSGRLWEKAG